MILSLVFCFVTFNGVTGSAETAGDNYEGPVVRVGLYAKTSSLDTRRFSSRNESRTGFEFGYVKNGDLVKLFSDGAKAIILLPQVNASANYSSEYGICRKGEGNVGAYSVIAGTYATYNEAREAALVYGDGFVALTDGGFEARFKPAHSKAALVSAGYTNIAEPVSGGITVLDAEAGKILFVWNATGNSLALQAQNGGNVALPVKHYSGNTNMYSYPGCFVYSVDSELLNMVNRVGLETYTKCVMSNEIGTSMTKETRRAFSVLARTCALGKKHSRQGFDVCSYSGCCQVYAGVYRMDETNNAIVDSTRGQYCAYDGDPITVLYHGSNGGASCSSVAAWGGEEVPYLTTVFLEDNENDEAKAWSKEFTKNEFYSYLKSRSRFSGLKDKNISMQILETDPYGSDYITVLSVSDGSGNSVTVENSEKIRAALGVNSANFSVTYVAEVDVLTAEGTVEKRRVEGILTAEGYKKFTSFGETYVTTSGKKISPTKVVISGVGAGHGVGFSAAGSEKLSKEGYNYKYILTFFFSGTEILCV